MGLHTNHVQTRSIAYLFKLNHHPRQVPFMGFRGKYQNKMKRHFLISYILSAFLALAAVSCNKESAPDTPRRAVRFNAAAANVALPESRSTRATDASWTLNDRVGIRMFNTQGNTVTGYENWLYTVSNAANGTFVPAAEDMYYPVDGSKVGFTAYYPYREAVTDSYAIDIKDQSNPAAIDLLYVKTAVDYTKENTSVPLAFNHQLSKFIIKTSVGNGITSLAGMSVTISGMPTTAAFNLHSGVSDTPANIADIFPVTVTDGALYHAIVIPGKDIANVTVDFKVGNETFTWQPNALTFEPGKSYIWEVTVGRTAVTVVGSDIKDWITVELGTGISN